MKVRPIKMQTLATKVVQTKKPTPIKDALIVSGYCSLPIVFYEAACWISKKVNKETNKNSETDWVV